MCLDWSSRAAAAEDEEGPISAAAWQHRDAEGRMIRALSIALRVTNIMFTIWIFRLGSMTGLMYEWAAENKRRRGELTGTAAAPANAACCGTVKCASGGAKQRHNLKAGVHPFGQQIISPAGRSAMAATITAASII